jgi:hypothetical protein
MDLGLSRADERIPIDVMEPVREPGLVIGGQAMDQEIRVPIHERRRRLEVPRLSLAERAACVLQLILGRRAACDARTELEADVVECLGEPVALDGRADREGPRAPAALEVAPCAVREPTLLAQFGVETGCELPPEDLVEDQDLSLAGQPPSPTWPRPDDRLSGGAVEARPGGDGPSQRRRDRW